VFLVGQHGAGKPGRFGRVTALDGFTLNQLPGTVPPGATRASRTCSAHQPRHRFVWLSRVVPGSNNTNRVPIIMGPVTSLG
jgi:hypothetical protein